MNSDALNQIDSPKGGSISKKSSAEEQTLETNDEVAAVAAAASAKSNEVETSEECADSEKANAALGNDSHLFIEDAIKELLKARRILRCSYVYGYYLDTFGHQKFIFEFIQTEFEECTENLSQIIAR